MSIVVFAPHPDDEALITAGVIKASIDKGEKVIVVNVTNGDCEGAATGRIRIMESIDAMNLIGLSPNDHIFMGYGDLTLSQLYYANSDMEIIPGAASYTNGISNYIEDFHSLIYKRAGDYNRNTLFSDIETILRIYKPNDIYVTSLYDSLSDHSGLYLFVVGSIIKMKKEYHNYSPTLHESIVHAPYKITDWPFLETDPSPLVKFPKPTGLDSTPLDWNAIEDVPVPSSMQIVPRTNNLKYKVISKYKSQLSDFIKSFVKSNEFFWKKDFTNIACLSCVAVSSENRCFGQLGTSAVDSIIGGYPLHPSSEWVTNEELNGAWIKLSWPRNYLINRIVLYNSPYRVNKIQEATLKFSDGSSIKVYDLSNNIGYTLAFEPKLISWVKLTIDRAIGFNTGLSEFEVYDSNIAYKANVSVSSENISTNQLGIKAVDGRVDGYPWDYTREWVTNGQGAGAWIKLSWSKKYTVDRVVLFDRCNGYDNILKGHLTFSDGSTIAVGKLKTDKTGDVITFPPKSISSVKFTIDEAVGANVGLTEFEVHSVT